MIDIEKFLAEISDRVRKKGLGPAVSRELEETLWDKANPKKQEGLAAAVVTENQPRKTAGMTSGADIAILTALHDPECKQVLSAFGDTGVREGRDGVLFRLIDTALCGQRIRIVVATQTEMGMVPASILATKTIREWQPRLIVMTGICAGARNKGVNLGDVIVAKQVFDYGSGKLVEGKIVPDYNPVSCENTLCDYLQDFAGDRDALHSIRQSWPLNGPETPKTELKVLVGCMASGAAVVAADDTVAEIQKHKRSLIAVDMEAYGVAKAAHHASPRRIAFLIIKGVQDYADSFKSDIFREYAAFMSARFAKAFLDKHLKQILL